MVDIPVVVSVFLFLYAEAKLIKTFNFPLSGPESKQLKFANQLKGRNVSITFEKESKSFKKIAYSV